MTPTRLDRPKRRDEASGTALWPPRPTNARQGAARAGHGGTGLTPRARSRDTPATTPTSTPAAAPTNTPPKQATRPTAARLHAPRRFGDRRGWGRSCRRRRIPDSTATADDTPKSRVVGRRRTPFLCGSACAVWLGFIPAVVGRLRSGELPDDVCQPLLRPVGQPDVAIGPEIAKPPVPKPRAVRS